MEALYNGRREITKLGGWLRMKREHGVERVHRVLRRSRTKTTKQWEHDVLN